MYIYVFLEAVKKCYKLPSSSFVLSLFALAAKKIASLPFIPGHECVGEVGLLSFNIIVFLIIQKLTHFY